MRQMVKVDLDGSPQQIFGVLKDLEAYESWLGFVDSGSRRRLSMLASYASSPNRTFREVKAIANGFDRG